MEGANMNSLDAVFKKWEKKGEERRQNPSRNLAGNIGNDRNVVQPGRAAWMQRFDSSSLPRRRTARRKNQDFDAFSSSLSAPVERKFHLIPPVVDDIHRSSRPFITTGCPRCSHKSKAVFLTEKVTNSPLRNLLDLSVFCRKNLLRKAFSDILYVANLPSETKPKNSTDIMTAVLKSSSVCSAIQELTSCDDQKQPGSSNTQTVEEKEGVPVITSKELELEAKKVLSIMSSSIKGYLIKLSTWFLFKFFGNVMSSIQVHQGQVTMLNEASKRGIPIIYLPLHKSHVDYILLSFVLSCQGLKVPYIAAGDNLKDIPLFSWLMRNMGGFFIKRSLGDGDIPQNELYKVILNEYIAQILESGNSLEVYIEGTRSRSGKCYPPKIGILSSIVSTVMDGRVSDVLVVPVNISYEKILENGYSGELLGEPKKTESFLQIIKGIWGILWSHFGQVRVDFGLPFSLMEHIRFAETSEACQKFMKTTTERLSPSLALENSAIKNSMSEISLECLDRSSVSLTKSIAHHVIYDCVHCSTIMSTNMVAFLLLTRFRKGVEVDELESALELLKKDVLIRKRDFGFSGSSNAVISHSIKILGEELVSFDPTSRLIRPNLALPSVLKLSYYGNQVLSVYVLESVVACSIGALLADENVSLSELIYKDITVSRRELLDTALDLCDLLCREFVFSPPCVSLETSLIEAIESLIAADILQVCEDQSMKSRESQWANRLAVSTGWFDDDESEDEVEIPDQEYKVNSSEEAVKKLTFFRSILSPIIESYWFVACRALSLRDQDLTERDFIKMLHASAIKRVEAGTALYNESCSLVQLTNAIKVFKECNIFQTCQQDGVSSPVLKLNNGFQTDSVILDLVSQINRYKT